MTSAQKDFLIGLLFMAASLVVIFFVTPNQIKVGAVHGLPPTFFPNVICWLIVFLSCCLIYKSIKADSKGIKDSFKMFFVFIKGNMTELRHVAVIFLIMVLYYVSLGYIGYFISTPVAIFAMAFYFGWRKIVPLVLISAGVTYLIFYLFNSVMQIPLP